MVRYCLIILCLVFVVNPARAATLESPARGATLSGLGSIYGWKCDAGRITVRINDGGHIPVATGQPRADARHICGTVNHGFITQMNWALLGDGTHTIVAYDNGVEFASATFDVTTFDEEYVEDAEGNFTLRDFPNPGQTSYFEWNESTQHMELVDFSRQGTPPPPEPEPEPEQTGVNQFLGTWRLTNSRTTQTYRFRGCPSNVVLHPCVADVPQLTYLWPTGLFEGLGQLGHSYYLADVERGVCRVYLLYNPTGGRVSGHYGEAHGNCLSNAALTTITADLASRRYPTTGTRTSRSTAQVLSHDVTAEDTAADVTPEDREKIERAIEESLFLLME